MELVVSNISVRSVLDGIMISIELSESLQAKVVIKKTNVTTIKLSIWEGIRIVISPKIIRASTIIEQLLNEVNKIHLTLQQK